ncbi:RNA-binding domain-containing protein [Ralstonia nicotianae]|uniref:RNA-binding domain-containing protein n=1 Tax=Ralstonia pseudosolanacearum TaxID=1310165 RepID=UPI001FFB378B|nr:RNA-binding domain-containing protein [Ralstonia pseudosolanacearum]
MTPATLLSALHKSTVDGQLTHEATSAITGLDSVLQECEVLDLKRQLPKSEIEYAKTVRDLVAMHNSYGGFLVFGVEESEKDRAFRIAGVGEESINIGKMRDMMSSATGTALRIIITRLNHDGLHLEVAWIAKRDIGDPPVRFAKNGPEEKPGKLLFKKNDVVFRKIDTNAVASGADDYDFLYSDRRPPNISDLIDLPFRLEPLDNNLPDRSIICSNFVGRGEDVGDLWAWLSDDFSRVKLVAGEGGLGKTSLAYRFAELIATHRVKPFNRIIWLTAKQKQFIPSKDEYRNATIVDFSDADSLFSAIASSIGCISSDFFGLDTKGLMQLALETCSEDPSFIVIDDVDSLTPDDQQRAMEFGLRAPQSCKVLLTTRVNFSYSPDNVLKLNGLPPQDFSDFVEVLRDRYKLPKISEARMTKLRDVTGGSPLFTDSLIRLELRGLTLDQAINQWKGEKGMEARKAALQREVQQLSKESKRVLFVVSTLRSCSYVELSQVVDYSDQTLGDALQELSGLFLISAPSIAREARFTVEPNTGKLVIEISGTLGIDHSALLNSTKKLRSDAIGLGIHKRSSIVGLAISDAIALQRKGDAKGAVDVVRAASRKLSTPHPDLLLALGRFSLKLPSPNLEEARQAFEQAYTLGQMKPLLFDLWFETEVARGSYDQAANVATTAIDHGLDRSNWFERRAETNVALATRAQSSISSDSAIRHLRHAIGDLQEAAKSATGAIRVRRIETLIRQATSLQQKLARDSLEYR